MDAPDAPQPARLPQNSLQLPAAQRLTLPASIRLSTITEGPSAYRVSGDPRATAAPSYKTNPSRYSTGNASSRTAPPAYGWIGDESAVERQSQSLAALQRPVEGEKVARLRRETWARRRMGQPRSRGGWGRVAIIVGVVLIALAIGLGVGLGVGLKNRINNNSNGSNQSSGSSSSGSGSNSSFPFPVGDYTLGTALRQTSSSCTSNSATWRCYPYNVYSSSSSSSSSVAIFDWMITNTSSLYATNTSATTSTTTSNLTLSSVTNPFSATFSEQALTYNPSAHTLTFAFPLLKRVFPAAPITSSSATTICVYPNATLSGTLTLVNSSASLYPLPAAGTGAAWPYKVEVVETSSQSPTCYYAVDGQPGTEIDGVPAALGAGEGGDCGCVYRNY